MLGRVNNVVCVPYLAGPLAISSLFRRMLPFSTTVNIQCHFLISFFDKRRISYFKTNSFEGTS